MDVGCLRHWGRSHKPSLFGSIIRLEPTRAVHALSRISRECNIHKHLVMPPCSSASRTMCIIRYALTLGGLGGKNVCQIELGFCGGVRLAVMRIDALLSHNAINN